MVQKEKYAVVACLNCEFVRVVDQTNKTSQCGRCGKQRKMQKLKKFVETNSQEKARLVASEIRAKQQNMEDSFREAYESGEMDMNNYTGISGPNDWMKEAETEEKDARSDKQIILDAIEELDVASRENVVNKAVNDGVTESVVDKFLSRMRQQGDVIQTAEREYRVL